MGSGKWDFSSYAWMTTDCGQFKKKDTERDTSVQTYVTMPAEREYDRL